MIRAYCGVTCRRFCCVIHQLELSSVGGSGSCVCIEDQSVLSNLRVKGLSCLPDGLVCTLASRLQADITTPEQIAY